MEAEFGARHRGCRRAPIIVALTGKLELTGMVCQIRAAVLATTAGEAVSVAQDRSA
jgi:hypothetical protein